MATQRTDIGILGIGTYLPTEVRTNAFWSESTVRSWSERRERPRTTLPSAEEPAAPPTEGVLRARKVMESLRSDPFQGARERRVIPAGMKASEMAIRAGEEAIARAGIERARIGMLLSQSIAPDSMSPPDVGLVHRGLGLPHKCLSTGADSVCNSFVTQLALAQQMIASGRVEYALLTAASNFSVVLDPREPVSPQFGDGASAVVVGPVSRGRGVLSAQFRTDGTLYEGIVARSREGEWYDGQRVVVHSVDAAVGRRTFLGLPDMAKEVMDATLAEAGVRPGDIDFFGVHQGMSWARDVLTDHLGFTKARTVETFAWAASIGAANIPLALTIAEREGMLGDDGLVAMFAGGAGLTYSAAVLRWGR